MIGVEKMRRNKNEIILETKKTFITIPGFGDC